MRMAVTGAAGFIGSHLTNAMAPDHEVVGFDNSRSGDWQRVGTEVQRVDIDIVEPDSDQWAEMLVGTDTLFHLAAEKYNSSKSTPQRVIDTNISATARLLRGAADAGVRKVVFTSSLYAYGSVGPELMRETQPLTPTTYYGVSKGAGEGLLRVADRDHDLAWACARLFFVYGPRQHAQGGYKSVILTNFERMLRGDPPVINGSGRQRLDYVYIADVVEALRRLADPAADRLTVNIASGAGPTITELTSLMQGIAGNRSQPIHAPPDWTEGTTRVGDPALAEELTGWSARTDLESGLRTVWNWMVTS